MSVVVLDPKDLCAACGEYGVLFRQEGQLIELRAVEANDLCGRCWNWCSKAGLIVRTLDLGEPVAREVRAKSPYVRSMEALQDGERDGGVER